MPFFGSNEPGTGASDPPEGLSEGELPRAASERMAEFAATDLFTSTMSVNEFSLLSGLGPRPLAQVMGTSVYQVGWQYLPPDAQWRGDDLIWPLDVISRAWASARQNAFARLQTEAKLVGADAVVGVHLHRGTHDWARRSVDFVVNGTAIGLPSTDPAGASGTRAPEPVLSDLSVQDYWKLRTAGWGPAGLLAATSAMFVSVGGWTRGRQRRSFMENQELWAFSDGFSTARRAVVAELRKQARLANADGVVGVSFQPEITRGKFRVQAGGQPGVLSPSSVALGVEDLTLGGGGDKREGIVFTVHAVGSAIRRDRVVDRPAAQAVLSLGGV